MKSSPRSDWSFRSILCPVDFSAQSRLALHAAGTLAARFDAHITVLFGDDPLLWQAARIAFDPRAVKKTAEAELRRFVQRTIGRDHDDRVIAYEIVAGKPAAEIHKAARRASADLVVMGMHGLSGPKKLMFGSTTEAVLRNTRVPVLAVPPGAARLVRHRSWPGKTLAAAIELTAHAASDVRAAAKVARAFGTSLVLVHVVRPTPGPPWLRARLRDQDLARLTKARARLQALGAAVRGVKVQTRILLGDPAEEIAALAADSDAGLMVVILRRGRGLFGPRRGSITYRVLSGTSTPLLAIPAS